MKTPSQDLFNFIHSMSSSEKRYFKKDTRDSNTLDLFDIINEMESYDEDEVKNRLKDSSYAGNLKVHKNRLQQILLKNLRSFHEEKTAQSKIKVLIENSEIYLKKKLFEQAVAQLDKAIQYCEHYEEYELKLQALGIKSRLSSYFTELDAFEETPIVEMERCARQIQNYIQHAIVNKKILHLVNSESSALNAVELSEKIEVLIRSEIIEKGQDPISSIAERMYLHSQAIMYDAKGDLVKACQLTKKIVEKFESNPYIVEEKNAQYLNTIINFLDFCSRLPDAQQELERYVQKAETHAAVYDHLMPSLLYIYYSFMESLRIGRRFEKMNALYESKIKTLIEDYHLENTYMAAKAMIFPIESNLAMGNYEQAAEILRTVLNLKQHLPLSLKITLRIIELLYHYDRSDFLFLDNLLQALQKKIRKHNEQSRFLENLLNLFKKLSSANVAEHKNLLQLYRTAVPTYSEDLYYKQLNHYIDFPVWLDSHIRKQSYLFITEEKKRLKT